MNDEKTPEKEPTSRERQSQRTRTTGDRARTAPRETRECQGSGSTSEQVDAEQRSAKLGSKGAPTTSKASTNQRRLRSRRGAELNTEERDRSTKQRARGARATAKATTNQRIPTGRHGADQSNQQVDRAEECSGGSGGTGDKPW